MSGLMPATVHAVPDVGDSPLPVERLPPTDACLAAPPVLTSPPGAWTQRSTHTIQQPKILQGGSAVLLEGPRFCGVDGKAVHIPRMGQPVLRTP
jgi:hypothetical protein